MAKTVQKKTAQKSKPKTQKGVTIEKRQETKVKVKDEENLWQKYLTKFRSLTGIEELDLHWKQGQIISEIHQRWKGAGLSRLSEETGLATKYIQEIWRFYQAFSPKTWVRDLPYKLHAAVAWGYQLALMRNPKFEKGYTPKQWLTKFQENNWRGEELEQRIALYYGLVAPRELPNLEGIILERESSDWEIHPTAKEEMKFALQKIKAKELSSAEQSIEEPVKIPKSHIYDIVYSCKLAASNRKEAFQKIQEKLKKGDFSEKDFLIQ